MIGKGTAYTFFKAKQPAQANGADVFPMHPIYAMIWEARKGNHLSLNGFYPRHMPDGDGEHVAAVMDLKYHAKDGFFRVCHEPVPVPAAARISSTQRPIPSLLLFRQRS